MVSLEELQNACMCLRSKRTIAHINSKEGDCWDIATYVAASAAYLLEEDGCHYQRVKAADATTIVEDELELVATIVDK
jgi:hypothetical protein